MISPNLVLDLDILSLIYIHSECVYLYNYAHSEFSADSSFRFHLPNEPFSADVTLRGRPFISL